MAIYFVGRRQFSSDPFRIVYKEVKTRTRKGNPLTFELKSLEAEYQTWEEAWKAVAELNTGSQPGMIGSVVCPPWPW